jgi:hypothetical protein
VIVAVVAAALGTAVAVTRNHTLRPHEPATTA